MKYVNTKTGAVIEFDGTIKGGDWKKVTDSSKDEGTEKTKKISKKSEE